MPVPLWYNITIMNQNRIIKTCKRILLIATSVIALLLIAGVLIVYFFEDKIIRYAIAEINDNLNTKIEVQEIHLSLWKKFPQASLAFKQVSCDEISDQKDKAKLLKAQSIYLSFNVWDIFSGNYTFKHIDIENASLYLRIDKNGKNNFSILKKNEKMKSSSSESFRFNRIGLKNIHLDFENRQRDQSIRLLIVSSKMSGQLSEQKHKAAIVSSIFIEQLKMGDIDLLQNTNVKLNIRFENNSKEQLLSVKNAEISIENLQVNGSGIVKTDSTGFIDIQLSGKKINIQSFISLLPGEWKKFEDEYKSKGEFYLQMSVKGNTSKGYTPDINMNFGIRDGQVTYKPSGHQMNNIQLAGMYQSSQNAKNRQLSVSSFQGQLKQSSIKGTLTYTWAKNNSLAFTTQSIIHLSELHNFLPIPGISSMDGLMEVNANFSGETTDNHPFTIHDYQRSSLSGNAFLKGVSIVPEEKKHVFTKISGKLEFSNSNAKLIEVSGMLGSSDITLNGTLENLPAYLFLPDAPLQIRANLHANHFILHELLTDDNHKKSSQSKWKAELPDRVDLSLILTMNRLTFNKFEAKQISGAANFKNQYLSVDNLQMQAFGGNTTLRGTARMITDSTMLITCQSVLSKIQLQRLFYECDNFGQKSIIDENIGGKLDASIKLSVEFNQQLVARLSTLQVIADLTIHEGEIKNLTSLESLSKFIRVEELKHIRFATLTNQIIIENETIRMPEMNILSSAININLSGTHTFDNIIDYRFNVLLKDLLAQKFKRNRNQEEFGEIIEDENSGARLYLKMTGPANDPKVSYDGKSVREKMKEDMKKEKQNLKQILHEEFGWFKKDSTIQKSTPFPTEKKEKKKNELQSDEFEFE